MGAQGLSIRADVPAAELRRLARRKPDRAAAARMFAIAHALDGMSRAEAARLAGMERQALRDAVVRYNAEGLVGLHNRPHAGPTPRLDAARQAELRELVLTGPDVEATSLSAWTLADLCAEVKRRWDVGFHPGHISKLVRALGLSRQKAHPSHPKADLDAQAAFAKRGFRRWLPRCGKHTRASA